MLHDLSFLDVEAQWPPPSEEARLERYRKNRLLFDSRADQVYGKWVEILRDGAPEQTHYVLSFHARLSYLWADLVVGEPPEYSAGVAGEVASLTELESSEGGEDNQGSAEAREETTRALNLLIEENGFNSTAHEVLLDVSRYGDGLFRLRVEDGAVRVEGQSPEYWFPVVSPSNVRNIRYHVLAWVFAPDDTSRYLWVEVHEAGRVEHRLYTLGATGVITSRVEQPRLVAPDFPEQEVETTGLDVPLVFHAPGARTTDALHGRDDYVPLDSSLEYLMWNMALRQAVFYKHHDPWMSGPPLETRVLPDGRVVVASGSRYIQLHDREDPRPEYHTFDGKLDGSFTQDEKLWENFYLESETSPTAFDHSSTGSAESGTSRRLRLDATLRKARRIRQRIDPIVRQTLQAAGKLAGTDFGRVTVEWHDGLAGDPNEESQITERDVRSGITSRRTAMMRRYGYTQQQAAEEYERINEELDVDEARQERAATRAEDRILAEPDEGSLGEGVM